MPADESKARLKRSGNIFQSEDRAWFVCNKPIHCLRAQDFRVRVLIRYFTMTSMFERRIINQTDWVSKKHNSNM